MKVSAKPAGVVSNIGLCCATGIARAHVHVALGPVLKGG